jgi:tetrahydromethanopterin:alpha-L-glutamate ligase
MPLSGSSAAGSPRILLVSDQADWHARQMQAAYRTRGVALTRVDLAACSFVTQSPSGLHLAELGSLLPDAVHVRTLSGGSFESITKRLGVLHALSRLGVLIWNDAQAIERCVDKSMTSFLLARASVPTPPTWTMESRLDAHALVERELPLGPLVLKPLFGAQGKGLRLILRADDLPPAEEVAGVYYLQRFLPSDAHEFRDFRLLVVRGRVVAAMMRSNSRWITNIKQGGRPTAHRPDAAMQRLAVKAAEVVGAAIAGVDVLIGENGELSVLEVNSMPAWSGLQKVTANNIAAVVADSLIDEMAMRRTAS